MKAGYMITCNDGTDCCEKFPIIAVFNFNTLNEYRAHSCTLSIVNTDMSTHTVAIFKIKPKPCKQPQ